jgi:hypothetical protein
MRRSLVWSVLLAYVLLFSSVVSYAQGAGVVGPPLPTQSTATQFNLWMYSDSVLASFLRTSHPGVAIITPGNFPDSLAPAIKAAKYAVMEGIGGYSAAWAQGQDAHTGASNPALIGAVQGYIDAAAKNGATYIYVDEPWGAPGESTAKSAKSIAYDVKGYNILYNYIHYKWPGVQFGLTIGDDGGAPLHLAMLKAGLYEDFASEEEYNSCCTKQNPFIVDGQKAQFPNVKTMGLLYGTQSLCQSNGVYPGAAAKSGFDIIAFWNVDNYGGFIGPFLDANWLQNAETYAQTGNTSFCTIPMSRVNPNFWTDDTQTKNFTVGVQDKYWQEPSPYKIASCDYQVLSGAKAINGPSDPSVTVTLGWTPRACNGNITITVGAGGNCRTIGSETCLVFTRSKTTTGVYGNVTYQEYSIQY